MCVFNFNVFNVLPSKRATFAFGAPATSWSCPTRDISWNNKFHCASNETCDHVFLRPNRRSILKPVVGHAPETGTNIQRTTLNKPQRSKATRTSSRNPQGPPRPGSADTPTSNGTSVKTKKSTAVRSSKKSATVPKQLDVKVNLSNRDNTYVAPHSRAPAVSRANGNSGSLLTYSRIPLHLLGKTPGAADAIIDSAKSNHR